VQSIVGFSITRSFVNRVLVQQLHLRKFKAQIPVQGINEATKTNLYAASLEIKSSFSNWETKIFCDVLLKIIGMIPATFVDSSVWGIPEGLVLADENFNRPISIDLQPRMLVLIGEDNLPPTSWRLAIISETFPGSDGHVRVVTVKTLTDNLSYRFIN